MQSRPNENYRQFINVSLNFGIWKKDSTFQGLFPRSLLGNHGSFTLVKLKHDCSVTTLTPKNMKVLK